MKYLGGYGEPGAIDLLGCLAHHLRSIGIPINIDDVRAHLHRGDAVLLLDSIDEGIAVYPDVVDRLSLFAQAFPKCQFITSSRDSVLRDLTIPFHQVTLLPFNEEQLATFFHKWFKGDIHCSGAIETHLKRHKKLHSVVTNPLSATILCVLFANGVPLPQCEASLYSTRLDLLAGKFDREKGLCRLKNPADTLADAATVIGFEMHKERLRSATTAAIEEFLAVNRIGFNKEERESIVQDMLTSEILMHTSSTNLSFGHLRFQEFLASEELKNRRSFPTDKLLRDPWWNGPLMIYVQTAREVEWLFNHAVANDYVAEVRRLLQAIADMRPRREKDMLLRRISISLADIEQPF